MSKKSFNPAKPHDHYCSQCCATFHCRAANCEKPQYFECNACEQGATLEIYNGSICRFWPKPAPIHQIDYELE